MNLITNVEVTMLTGAGDTLCTADSAKRVLDLIGSEEKELKIVEKLDASVEDSPPMDH